MRGSPLRFASSGDLNLAYQLVGQGERTILFDSMMFISIDQVDEFGPTARFLERLGTLGRLLLYDRRGVGLSDPIDRTNVGTTTELAEDIVAILDDAEIAVLTVVADSFPAAVAVELAYRWPERVEQLILVDPIVRTRTTADFPFGRTAAEASEIVQAVLTGKAVTPDLQAPPDEPTFRNWLDRAGRHGASPRSAQAIYDSYGRFDVRALLGELRQPVLVVDQEGHRILGVSQSAWVAERVPNGRLRVVPWSHMVVWFADADEVLGEVEEFVTGVRGAAPSDRVLACLLITDLVASTERAAQLGDARWAQLLERHDELVAEALRRFHGVVVNPTGDGVLATLPTPTAAVSCARAIRTSLQPLGLSLRAAIHVGEFERRGTDIGGIAVHLTSRLLAMACPDQILVSGAVPPLVVGQDLGLVRLGVQTLRDIPGEWEVLEAP